MQDAQDFNGVAVYPHERSLVKHLEGKPFALMSVNSASDREALKEVLTRDQNSS
jgi:hypothetical protein